MGHPTSPSPACSALPGLPVYTELAGAGRVSPEPAAVRGETGGLWWAHGCWTLPGHPLVRHVEELHVLLGWGPCLWPAVCALGGQHCGRWCPRLLLGCVVGVPLSPAVPTWELGSPVLAGAWNNPRDGQLLGGSSPACPAAAQSRLDQAGPHLALPCSPWGAGGALREGAGYLLPPLLCVTPFLVGSGRGHKTSLGDVPCGG